MTLGETDFAVRQREGRLALEQLGLALRALAPNFWLMPILAFVVCLIFSRWIGAFRLSLFFAAVALGGLPLAIVSHLFQRRMPAAEEARLWVRRCCAAYLVFALAWASMSFLLWAPGGDDLNHLLIVMLLACTIAGNGALIGASKPLSLVAYATYGPALILAPLQQGDFIYSGLAVLATLYLGYLIYMSQQIYRTARDMLCLRFEKNDLIVALAASKAESDQARKRAEQRRMQASLGFVERNQRRQPVRHQRTQQAEIFQRAIRQFGCAEKTLRQLGEQKAELGAIAFIRDLKLRAREGVVDRRGQLGDVLTNVEQCREHSREVVPVGGERWRRDAERWLADGRTGIGAEVVIKPPVNELAAYDIELRIAGGIADTFQHGFGRQQRGRMGVARTVGIAQHDGAVLALHHRHVAASMANGKPLLLDQRLQLKRRLCWRGETDLDLVGHVVVEMRFQCEADGIPLVPYTGPQDGLDAAFGGYGACDRAICGGPKQRQPVVEIGLADTVAADENRQLADR